jgi:flagellar biosynthesis protein FliP
VSSRRQIIITLSLFLSFHVMAPVWQKIEAESVRGHTTIAKFNGSAKRSIQNSFLGDLTKGPEIRSVA